MMSLIEEVACLIKEGNNERAKELLKKNPQLYQSDKASGHSLLHYGAAYNNVHMVHYLLDNGYNIDIQDNLGRTPLMMAVETGQNEVAGVLLHAGANFDELLSNSNKSVLHLTFANHLVSAPFLAQLLTKLKKKFTTSEETAQKLMDTGCHLYQAVCSKDDKIIEYMLNHESSIHFFHPRDKLSALHFAVYYEDSKIVDLLWECGAAVSALDIQGRTPLFYLYYRNSSHTVEKLKILKLFLGYDTLLVLRKCMCVIFQIANILIHGNHEAVRLLLQAYPDFTGKEKYSEKTMLHHLARNKNPRVIEELRPHINKFNINAIDKKGHNPLYWALKAGNINMVRYLLEQGTNVPCTHYIANFPRLYFTQPKLRLNLKINQFSKLLLKHNNGDQFILGENSCKKVRIFGIEEKKNYFKRIKLSIAHLAVLEQLGKSITKVTWSKIKSLPSLKRYFKKCQRVLQTEICGKVTIFRLLVDDEKKIASYLNKKTLDLKLERASYKRKLRFFFPCYFNTVRECFLEGRFRKTLKDNVTIIFSKISDNRLVNSLVLNKIMDYLDNKDLQNLYHAYK